MQLLTARFSLGGKTQVFIQLLDFGLRVFVLVSLFQFKSSEASLYNHCDNPWNLSLELPRLQLVADNGSSLLSIFNLDHPEQENTTSEKSHIVTVGSLWRKARAVSALDTMMICTAPYPVLLVVLRPDPNPNPKEDSAFLSSRMYTFGEKFFVSSTSDSTKNSSDNFITKFETRSSFRLSVDFNVSTFACEAVHNPCLRSREKLQFTKEKESLDSDEEPVFNFTVKMTLDSESQSNIVNFSAVGENKNVYYTNNDNTRTTKLEAELELDCDAIFYYEHVEEKSSEHDEIFFHLIYTCEFSDGSPGIVKMNQCENIGRCNLPRWRKKTVKNCWKKYLPGKTCLNCRSLKKMLNQYNFVPICITDEGASEKTNHFLRNFEEYLVSKRGTEEKVRVAVGTPLYFGFPSGYNISRPDIRTWDDETLGNERMIRMLIFEEVHLLNSVLKVTCESSSTYTAKAMKFAFSYKNADQNTSKMALEFFKITDDFKGVNLAYASLGAIYTQTVEIHLNQTHLDLNLERIFCFAPVQNSYVWVQASRSIRVVSHVQDLFKPSRCKNSKGRKAIEYSLEQPNPRLLLETVEYYAPGAGESDVVLENDTELAFDPDKTFIICEAGYPIQIIHNSIYRQPNSFAGKDGKYSSEQIFTFFGKIYGSGRYSFSTQGFDFAAKSNDSFQFFRCESIQNPCLHRSFQFFRRSGQNLTGEANEQLMLRNFPPETEPEKSPSETLKTELGRPANYSECEVLFFYRKLPHFPGYEFRCEFLLQQRGTVNFHYCDSMNDCANKWRNKRQPRNCWREVKSWDKCDDNNPCLIEKGTGFKPFVATCTLDRFQYRTDLVIDDEPQFRVSTLGSFAVFGIAEKLEEIPPIYFSEDEIDPEKMTFLEPFDPFQFPGLSLTVTCRVSAFFNNPENLDVRIAKYFGQRNIFTLQNATKEDIRAELNADRHYWSMTTSVELGFTSALSHIYCLGLHWKRSNSSREIHLYFPESPEIALHVQDSQGERIIVERGQQKQEKEPDSAEEDREEFFQLSSTNVSLACHAYGYPPPEISWTRTAASKPDPEYTVKNATHSVSTIVLPVVDVGVRGTYICKAQNGKDQISTHMRVGIKYPVNKSVVAIISFASFIVLILILALLNFLRRIRKLKMTLRDLSDEEVRRFHFGDTTVDPTDTNAEIYALEYDRRLEVSPELIDIDEKSLPLGTGEFGIVRRGILKSNEKENQETSTLTSASTSICVAVKMPKFNVTTENFKSFLYEIKIMSYVQNHENILKILAASTLTIKIRRALIALEFCELGDLKNFLRDKKDEFEDEFPRINLPDSESKSTSESTSESESDSSDDSEIDNYDNVSALISKPNGFKTVDLLNFSLGIANGMSFLAEKKVIHGDLAARNVLLTQNREVKISDFGFSTQLKNYETYTKTHWLVIPWRWFSIEALADRKFSHKSDCWAFGVLLYEIFSLGQDPYPGLDRLDPSFVQSLRDGYRLEKPEYANDEMYKLMRDCWLQNPGERPSFHEICDRILDLGKELVVPKLNFL